MKKILICFILFCAVCNKTYADTSAINTEDSFIRTGVEGSWSKVSSNNGIGGFVELGKTNLKLRILYDYIAYGNIDHTTLAGYAQFREITYVFNEQLICLGINKYFPLNKMISPYIGGGFTYNILNGSIEDNLQLNGAGKSYDTFTYLTASELGVMFNIGLRFETFNPESSAGLGAFIEARMVISPNPVFSRSYFVAGGYIKF